ncbi:hypothetical protein KC357_g7751 [Hortaea werneckii]|nr:hypothetical protein KC357_g7751 [Hortaea werneckii]
MCQICSMKQIASQDRWPKPLESEVQDINFLVQTIHTDYEANKSQCTTKETMPEELLENLRLLSLALEQLDHDREGGGTRLRRKSRGDDWKERDRIGS